MSREFFILIIDNPVCSLNTYFLLTGHEGAENLNPIKWEDAMKRALIIGATGFGGLGLIEILLRHPEITIGQLIARKDTGKPVSDIFPHLKGFCDLPVQEAGEIDYESADIAFFSTPDRAGMTLIKPFHEKSIPVVDFSGDFRFTSFEDYRVYATNKSMDTDHAARDLLDRTVYGLPEHNREDIRGATIVGNPGCYATAMILALLPAAENGLIGKDTVYCDGKTGVSGAGRSSGEANLYPQRYENVNSYREGRHQHLVEVENIISQVSGANSRILFVPHVIPMNRGILVDLYFEPARKIYPEDLIHLYNRYYGKEPFVRVTETSPGTAMVKGSNLCLIRPLYDARTERIVITAAIDNLIKGQSGNAVQNANCILGLDETAGLSNLPSYP